MAHALRGAGLRAPGRKARDVPARDLRDLAEHASPDAVAFAWDVLSQDLTDRRWLDHVGPALTQRDVARLLGKSEQAVAKDRGLLRIRNRDGRPVYPVVQFVGRTTLPALPEILRTLGDTLEPLTVASWLVTPQPALGARRPVDALRAGDTAPVLTAARRLAARAAH